jgi:hypothetical protein
METATTYTVPTTATVTQEQVDNLLCAAFEGGITYWCSDAEVLGEWPEGAHYTHETLTRGRDIRLTVPDDWNETTETYVLTLDNFLAGIARAASHFRQDVVTFLEDHDACSADVAVQFAALGEIVYG